ncbi:CBS domain-containing protein [uncultured Paraglaciecola sp.]|uniref:CBS domain-containing protein n=1 Tax=uncultured Paraglaciecola sp. TaxID=1765024 RepID=UPI0025D37EDD|nr:CBS domain-containing protein [uncultured Paraglaciecola sp.]
MNVGDICSKNIVSVSPLDSVADVARVMREQHVASVVVVDNKYGEIRPQGVITERDLVIEVLAAKIDPTSVRAEDILTSELICVTETHNVAEALKYLRFYAVRRAPVVNVNGILVGLFCIEDSLASLLEEYTGLVKLLSHALVNEKH